ncbi:hypothetical protein [Streptomyces sp. NPDC059130]
MTSTFLAGARVPGWSGAGLGLGGGMRLPHGRAGAAGDRLLLPGAFTA